MYPKISSSAKFPYGVITFPGTVTADASGWAISKNSKHKSSAIKFVQYLSSKESMDKFAQSGLIVPARIDSANSSSFLDGKKPYNAKVFLDVIQTSVPTRVSVDYRKILDDLKTKNELLFNPVEQE
jgi:ABC-type glycerol-3-phosphate transport system substrate-binding protein